MLGEYCSICKKMGKNKFFEVSKLKQHKTVYHKRAKSASKRNIESEKQYVKKLKNQNRNSLIFQTGKEKGVPDIGLYKNKKLIFYEVKPTQKENKSNSLLKKSQNAWIKKHCLGNRIDVYVVFYSGPTRKLRFTKKLLTRKNIGMYSKAQ